MVDLLEHNKIAYEKVKSAIADGKKKIAISHATGTGKSYLIVKLFEDYSNDKKLILVPSTYISDQVQALFEKYNIQNVDVILYQRLIKMSDEDIVVMDYSVIALDEYHHDTSKVWGEKVKTLIESHPESIIFGTSATPIRSDGVNTIDELFEGNCTSELPLSESIAKKIMPFPKYVGALYTLDNELEKLRKKIENATNTSEEKQEFYKKINAMRSQIVKSYGMPIILNKHITNKDGKYIIFCKNKKHLREIKDTVIEWFKTAGFKDIKAYEVYSDYENKDTEYKAFCDDTSYNMKLLFCVNMLNEGLHLENISGVLLLRPTRSMIVFLQQIGRAIEANNTNTPVIIDAVNNFSSAGQGMKLLGEIKDSIAKEKENDPDFDDSGFEDIDTFFVLEQVVEIQEMFREIEGRLQGSWDLYIRALKQYKGREGNCLVPCNHVEILDGIRINLGYWINNMRQAFKKKEHFALAQEKINILNEMGFVWNVESGFDRFCKYVLQYKKKFGHTNIKLNDQINGYNIGLLYFDLIKRYKKGKVTKEQVHILKNMGVDITLGTRNKQFKKNMEFAKQALKDGVVIDSKKRCYKGINLYNWYITHKDKMTVSELEIMNKLIPNRSNKRAITIIDIQNNELSTYSSMAEAGRTLCNDYHVVNSDKQGANVIYKHLVGKIRNPVYKGFRFEYAD